MMNTQPVTALDRALAAVCVRCPLCRRARHKQTGLVFRLVKYVDARLCPFCRAYDRVHGRPAHERPAAAGTDPTALG
jgi:hypothetical protein